MANYDASVRVNTKVNNSDLGKLQKDFDKLEETEKNTKKATKKTA